MVPALSLATAWATERSCSRRPRLVRKPEEFACCLAADVSATRRNRQRTASAAALLVVIDSRREPDAHRRWPLRRKSEQPGIRSSPVMFSPALDHRGTRSRTEGGRLRAPKFSVVARDQSLTRGTRVDLRAPHRGSGAVGRALVCVAARRIVAAMDSALAGLIARRARKCYPLLRLIPVRLLRRVAASPAVELRRSLSRGALALGSTVAIGVLLVHLPA
jgi:hypothetical protein